MGAEEGRSWGSGWPAGWVAGFSRPTSQGQGCFSGSPCRTITVSFVFQTAVDVFRRIILEAEKIDGAASQGKSSCSMM